MDPVRCQILVDACPDIRESVVERPERLFFFPEVDGRAFGSDGGPVCDGDGDLILANQTLGVAAVASKAY
jgi:hypothetical protein